jgi:hypothetical protein
VFQFFLPSYWSGKLSLNADTMLTNEEAGASHIGHAFNLGELAGLHGLASLLPLLGLWLIAAFLWLRVNRANQPQPST